MKVSEYVCFGGMTSLCRSRLRLRLFEVGGPKHQTDALRYAVDVKF